MSTHCTIGIKTERGIESIWCVNDGSLYWAGIILYKYYQKEEKVKKLISLGNLISIGKDVNFLTKQEYDYKYRNKTLIELIMEQDKPLEQKLEESDTVIDNNRRGKIHEDERHFIFKCPLLFTDYGYLYEDGTWWVYLIRHVTLKFKLNDFWESNTLFSKYNSIDEILNYFREQYITEELEYAEHSSIITIEIPK